MAQLATFRISQPKRTRVLNTKQSRGGCNTCKTRRVKCGEEKPTCQRCIRVDRVCEYGVKSASSTVSTISTPSSNPALSRSLSLGPTHDDLPTYRISPAYALSNGVWQNAEQSRLANLGCWVLSHDPMMDEVVIPHSAVWIQLLPQLVHSTRTAYASAAAFGAVYESFLICKDRTASEAQATTLYSNALSVLQENLNDLSSGTTPVLLSCILLACVEVVQRRRGNALRHLEGAFKVLEISDDASLCLTPSTSATTSTDSTPESAISSIFPKKDDLLLLLKALDLHSSTYTNRLPHFPASFDDMEPEFVSIRGADLRLLITLHNSHHFTFHASQMKYLPPATIPRETIIEQGRHIARLSLWLKCLDTNILHKNHKLPAPAYRHAMMLRAQCLCALVYVSTILCPYETEYDRYAASFQQIIEAAEVVVDAKAESSIRFRPGLGIIQPLLFSAVNYRHSRWRRQAIDLILRAGNEGPWVGEVEGTVARRVMDVEEETLDEPHEDITPEMIPECKRVCGSTLWGETDESKEDIKTKTLHVSISRCVDMDYMLSGKESFECPKHWNIWKEDIEIVR